MPMNELTNETLVSTQELADVLNVSERTVQRATEKLASVLSPLSKNKQGGYLFNEKQVTLIKQEIQSHHNLKSRQIYNVSTDYEMELMTKKVLEYHIMKEQELRKQLQEQQPKVELFDVAMDTTGLLDVGTVAKMLNWGRNKLFEFLRNNNIFMRNNIPYQKYVDSGYFKIKDNYVENLNKMLPKTYFTQKGIAYINKLLNK